MHCVALHSTGSVSDRLGGGETEVCSSFNLDVCSAATVALAFLLLAECDQRIDGCHPPLTLLFGG